MERDWTQKPAYYAARFEEWQFNWITPRYNRQLVNCSVGAKNGPTRTAHVRPNLREPLAAIKRLVIPAPGVAHSSIQFVEAHQVRVIRSCEKKFGAGARDSPHFAQCLPHIGNMLDGFAGNYQIKRLIGERQ